jgi:hypothetical protein
LIQGLFFSFSVGTENSGAPSGDVRESTIVSVLNTAESQRDVKDQNSEHAESGTR